MMRFIALLSCWMVLAAPSVYAAPGHEAHQHVAADALALTPGEVRKIDLPAGKLTIRHGPIVNLDMDAMTMVFRVADPAMLEGLKVGDKIGFVAEIIQGATVVTRIERAGP